MLTATGQLSLLVAGFPAEIWGRARVVAQPGPWGAGAQAPICRA